MYQQGQTGQDLSEFIIRQEVNGKLKISRALCEFAVSIVLDDDAQAELGEKAATEAEELNSAQKKWLVDHLEKSGLTALALEVL